MKKDLHPVNHFITVVQTDGTEYVTRTTAELPNDRMQLLMDPLNHPAYTGERKVMDSMGRIEKFAKKYGMQNPANDNAPKAANDNVAK